MRSSGRVHALPRMSPLQPGDLVFYGNPSTSVTHVALYIRGKQVVQAKDVGTLVRDGRVTSCWLRRSFASGCSERGVEIVDWIALLGIPIGTTGAWAKKCAGLRRAVTDHVAENDSPPLIAATSRR